MVANSETTSHWKMSFNAERLLLRLQSGCVYTSDELHDLSESEMKSEIIRQLLSRELIVYLPLKKWKLTTKGRNKAETLKSNARALMKERHG